MQISKIPKQLSNDSCIPKKIQLIREFKPELFARLHDDLKIHFMLRAREMPFLLIFHFIEIDRVIDSFDKNTSLMAPFMISYELNMVKKSFFFP
jgi:hypothetical protein